MRMEYTFLAVILQIFSFRFVVSKFPGEGCMLDFGRTGKCTQIYECPKAIEQIQNRGHPKTCGFEGVLPIVCCETTSFKSPVHVGETARNKCNEYAITSITTTTTTTTSSSLSPPGVQYAIGGVDAFPLEFPHMAILGYGSFDNIKWSCGGSLISKNFVLTAAHCIHTRLGTVQVVKLGVHQLNLTSIYEQAFTVKNVYQHPEYIGSQNYHDIALIELDHSADIQSGVKPACLHTSKEIPNSLLIGTGWGVVEIGGDIYNTLQKVNLRYVPWDACARYYDGQRALTNGINGDWQLCADGGGARADTCQGDSGGPLQTKFDGDSLYTVIGITSFGLKCALVPGVYTRVSYYVPWIESIVWPEESRPEPRASYYFFDSPK